MKQFMINGEFLERKLTGQERFALEVVLQLDKLVCEDAVVLVIPRFVENIPVLSNIKVIQYGSLHGMLWEQIDFMNYVRKNKGLSLNLCSIMPVFQPGLICIHDISYKVNPQFFRNLYGKLSKYWHLIQYNLAFKFSPLIYTVSEYSKKQMQEVYHVEESRIHVVPNGWQHFLRVMPDEHIFDKLNSVKKGDYYFSLGSLAPNKNLQWIYEVAKKNPTKKFVIAGASVGYASNEQMSHSENIILLDYLSDGEIKALMTYCRAFLFPSKFEGFGIPPLEALSVGAKIIVSNASCLPEIYQNCAYYIDPNDADVNLDVLLQQDVDDSSEVLQKYSFENAAKFIWNDLKRIQNEK